MSPPTIHRGIDDGPPLAGLSPYSNSNRRASASNPNRSYPWLLAFSTMVAGLFCLLYITKPVIQPTLQPPQFTQTKPTPHPTTPAVVDHPSNNKLLPSNDHLPGEQPTITAAPAEPSKNLPTTPSHYNFEETNLRIQHILTADAPGDHQHRIDLEVPVLYQSRNLRWTIDEAAEARSLLARLMNYQEKSLQLRTEGLALRDAWNHLIKRSIPSNELRADSPTLPSNQKDTEDTPRPADLSTPDAIQLKPAGK